MKNTLKKLMPFALTGVISGATVFGASQYFTKEKTEKISNTLRKHPRILLL